MTILSVLKAIGKDLGHVGSWIDDGLKIAEPIIGVTDPPLAAIIKAIEASLDKIPKGASLDAKSIQGMVTAVTATSASSVATGCCCCGRSCGEKGNV